jgi:hypothetical protein
MSDSRWAAQPSLALQQFCTAVLQSPTRSDGTRVHLPVAFHPGSDGEPMPPYR